MKLACLPFLFLTVSCAASMQETSYAASTQHASYKSQPHSRAGLIAANRSKQLPTSRKRSLTGNAASIRQPALSGSGGAEKGRFVQNETTGRGLTVRRASLLPSVASLNSSLKPLPDNVRRRGPSSAVVRGSANSRSSNTGAINGTGMHRRP